MRVAIQSFKNTGHAGRGVGVYGEQLIKYLKEIEDVEVIEFSDINEIHKKNVDVVHFLVFDLFQNTLPSNISIPSVVTVHDVTPLVFKKEYPSGIKGALNLFVQKRALKKIDKIITISNNSKKDINKHLGIDNKKIKVIYSGFGEQFKIANDRKEQKIVRDKYKLPDRYAFYSGNVNWNKNIVGMTDACIDADLDLVIVGKSFEQKENINHPEMRSYKQFLEKYENHPQVHILGFVPDGDLVAILNQATVALFVSFYEGFGFPILEAQACGVPVISAKTSSMPEIGGSGALYIDPKDIKEISCKITTVLNDEKLRNDLIDEGLLNIKRFSWKKTAEETYQLYKDLLKNERTV